MLKEDCRQILSAKLNWRQFLGKTILITGANGFLPAYMVEILLELNKSTLSDKPCKILALVRNQTHANARFKNYLNDIHFKLIVQDVVNELVYNDKIDYIIHAASPASPKYYLNDPVGVILPNIIGTKNTLDLAVKHSVQGYLYFSSSETYGQLADGAMIHENTYGYLDPTDIRSCYGESKRMGENLCVSYGHQYNIPIKIVRPFHTYGPGMKLDDGRVFADFVKNIICNENIELKSDGSAVRSFCYLADATIAFFKVLLEGKNNNAYNVANPMQAISIKELATILINLFPEKRLTVKFIKQNASYLQSPIKGQIPDISKIVSLGWEPQTTIISGFEKTIRSYK